MAAIFLSYRRDDNADRVNSIRTWLLNHGVPAEEIFLDSDGTSIPPRSPFPDRIGIAMQNALCALIVIGPRWLTFRRRGWRKKPALFEADDWVRREIEMALIKPVNRALTVLLDNTPMPATRDLPASLALLRERQIVRLRGGAADFDTDMLKIAEAMAGTLTERFRWDEGQRRFIYLLGERAGYLNALIARYAVLDLPVAGGVTLPAGEIYQPLRLRQNPAHPAEQSLEDHRGRQRKRGEYDERDADMADMHDIPGDDSHDRARDAQGQALRVRADNPSQALALSSTRRMVVLGGPGSGKTTLLHQLALDAALRAQDDGAMPLPVVLSLPTLAEAGQWTAETLPEFIASTLEGMNKNLPPEKQAPTTIASLLAREVMRGATFLCLDGLDEVLPTRRRDILRWIGSLPAPVADAAIIIGSRFTEYREGDLPRGHYAEWELEQLTPQTRAALVTALLPRLRAAASTSGTSDTLLDAAQLLTHIGKSSAISWWGNSPLLLTLAAFVFVQRGGSLPQRRVELYDEVVSNLLEDRLRRDGELAPFTLRNTLDLLSAVTLDLFTTTGQVFTSTHLSEAIRASAREFTIVGESDASRMYQRVIHSGLLEPQARDAFKFRHPTFQEYLVGAELARMLTGAETKNRERAWNLVQEKSMMARWLEPLALMAGILVTQHGAAGQRIAAQWIGELSTRDATPQGDPGYLALGQAIHALRDAAGIPSPQLRQTTEVALNTWADVLANAARRGRHTLLRRMLALSPDIADIISLEGGSP